MHSALSLCSVVGNTIFNFFSHASHFFKYFSQEITRQTVKFDVVPPPPSWQKHSCSHQAMTSHSRSGFRQLKGVANFMEVSIHKTPDKSGHFQVKTFPSDTSDKKTATNNSDMFKMPPFVSSFSLWFIAKRPSVSDHTASTTAGSLQTPLFSVSKPT